MAKKLHRLYLVNTNNIYIMIEITDSATLVKHDIETFQSSHCTNIFLRKHCERGQKHWRHLSLNIGVCHSFSFFDKSDAVVI